MSQLIGASGLLTFLDDFGVMYTRLLPGIDQGNLRALKLVNIDLNAVFGSSGSNAGDYGQQNQWYPYVNGVTQALNTVGAIGTPLNNAFGGPTVGGGSFTYGQGLLNRSAELASIGFNLFEGVRKMIQAYGAQPPINQSTLVDLLTMAAYENANTPFSLLYSPDTASFFWYAYNQSKQLAAAAIPGGSGSIPYPPVFAPQGILLCTGTISGPNVVISNNAATNWPTANGYSSPAPTNTGPGNDCGDWSSITTYNLGDAALSDGIYYISLVNSNLNNTPASSPSDWAANTFGNNLYIGNTPMAQAFAPLKSAQVTIETNVDGTCALTVNAPAYDSSGASHASRPFTATLDNQTVGTVTQLTPTNAGDRMYGIPISMTFTGTATAGTWNCQSGQTERTIL